jgi:hypothetical protein
MHVGANTAGYSHICDGCWIDLLKKLSAELANPPTRVARNPLDE